MSGTYTLLVELPDPATVGFGAVGDRDLPAGWYAYTGSAFGPGGFARVDRHRRVASGDHDARHWHVDYLLGHPGSDVGAVERTEGADVECAVARRLADAATPVRGVGASDCDCGTHLVHCPDRDRLARAVRGAHRNAVE
ncbi:DUF123 domain-containing protein [Halobacteriales archaeon QS_8_69_26]|nr:MAG: DUF123 domain-containing protein [Halobacteriales archaeon QS_8_69_26]